MFIQFIRFFAFAPCAAAVVARLAGAFIVGVFTLTLVACGGGGGGGGGNSVAAPVMFNANSPEIGALHISDDDNSYWFVVGTVAVQGINLVGRGQSFNVQRQRVTRIMEPAGAQLQSVRVVPSTNSFFDAEITAVSPVVTLGSGEGQLFFETRADITMLAQLCTARWLGDYINANIPLSNGMTICVYPSGASFSPDMRRVVVAAIADGFSSGLSFADSPLGLFGRYDGNDRAAGFTYNFDTFALRTDYVRLPAKQDNNVWLDTYRLGLLRPLNDEVKVFAGVDNYNNVIFVMDANGENQHRFGVAVGDGYAVKYEWRLDL